MNVKKGKWIVILLAIAMLAAVGSAGYNEECPAAPDVAGQILEEFDIDFRYEAGTVEHPRHGERILYENYIAMVAQTMTNEAAFPAYDWYGNWDGETYVDKCEEDAYYQAVYNYLVGLGADLPKGLSVELVSGDIADGFVCQAIQNVGDGFPTVKVTDVHGNSVEGVGIRASLPTIAEIGGPILTDSNGTVIFDNLSYHVVGTYRINFYLADSKIREWSGYNRALSNWFDLDYEMVGDWKLDLYVGNTLNERFIVISTYTDGDIEGFFGVGYDPTGSPTGDITGTIDGDSIYMLYDRKDYGYDYTLEMVGTMDDCNSASGTGVIMPEPMNPGIWRDSNH